MFTLSLMDDNAATARALFERGAVAIPFLNTPDLDLAHERFSETLRWMPEYRPEATKYVLGGFGALGNPSSFHNPLVRELRWRAHEAVQPLFSHLGREGETRLTRQHKIHVIPDRMRILRPDAEVGAEQWHRDTTPASQVLPGDLIFGGWINLDRHRTQYLSAIPRSHRDPGVLTGGRGFETLSEADKEAAKARHEALPLVDRKVAVPPGHLLVFYQELLHEVLPRGKLTNTQLARDPALREPEYRLFTGWRLTRGDQPLSASLPDNYFRDMAVPALKSGQAVRMYPKTYYEFGAEAGVRALADWSRETFPDALITERRMRKANEYRVVPATLPSLAECLRRLDLENPYPPYSDDEVRLYRPHIVFRPINQSNVQAHFILGPADPT